jgi:hypothetical protein
MNDIKNVTYKHYRVPLGCGANKGRPSSISLLPYSRNETIPWAPEPCGGKTVCTLDLGKGVQVVGEAVCSYSDNFCYAEGRKIAHERAEKALKGMRKTTWEMSELDATPIAEVLLEAARHDAEVAKAMGNVNVS